MIIEKQDPDVAEHQYRDCFNLLFNQIEDCLFIFDEKGRIIQANKAALEKLEYPLEEMMSLNIELLHPLARREEVREIVKGMLVADISKYSIPLCTKSELQIPVETRVFKGKWEGNDVLYCISKDVSAVKKAEDHLAKALRCNSSMTALNIFGDPEFSDKVITRIKENGCVINCEVRIRDKTGYTDGLFLGEMINISNHNYLLTMTSDISERRKQERKLQKIYNIQSLINFMPFLAWMKDINGKYVALNKAYESFYNIKSSELIGKTDFELFPYKIALKYRKKDEEIIKFKINQKLNRIHIKNKNGNKWFEVLILPVFEDDGKVTGTIGILNNITEQVQLEMELANQKRFLKTMLDTIPDFIFYKDINSAYLGCNKACAEKVLGVNEDIVIGKTDLDITKDIKLAGFYRQEDQKVFVTSRALKYEEIIVLTDGSVIDAETVKTPFFDDQGNVAGLIGVSRDITERKRLEKQLREQAEYAELLFKTVPNAVLSVDKHRKITRWNKIAEEITGYTAAEVIGKECSTVLHGVGIEECNLCLNAYHSPLINQMCNIITKDGQIRHVLKSIAIVKDELGEIREKIECFEDITSLIDMDAELRESKETYSAIVNNAPQIVVILKDGIIEFVNDAGKVALGFEEGYNGRHIKEFMTENSFECLASELTEGIKGDYCVSYELDLIKKSGEIINVLLKGTGITFESEKACLAVMMDITESKQLNAKLQANKEKFKQFAETINEIFLITDKERIVYVSPAYERISGMSCQSLLDNPHALLELIHLADRERMRVSFPRNFLNMSIPVNEEFRIIRLDGEMRWLWLQSYPVLDNANNSPLKATSIVDITDRKNIEEKLFERERQTQMELFLAARVQQDSLPHPFAGDKVRVSTIFEPHSTVSGDFFNYKWFEEQDKLCGYILDVSGHGVATALQTATFKMMLDNVLLNGEKLEEDAIQTINQNLMHYLYEGSFVALLYFEFDFQARVLKLISAGITLFLAAKLKDCSLVPISGCYLGIVDNPEIGIETIPLNAGDIYFMMSDGASDLIELHGISKQGSSEEYKKWLEKLAESPDRNDDFSVICIEILQENKETNVLDIKNDRDLECAQVLISEFLARNALSHATMLEVAIHEALNNGFYAGGQVRVTLKRMGGKLIIRIKDDGPGFNTKGVNFQHEKEIYEERFDQLLEAESGRGLLLMKIFCDKVIYNAIGNEVLLMKKI